MSRGTFNQRLLETLRNHTMALAFGGYSRPVVAVVIVASNACHSVLPRHGATPSYLVTEAPINVGLDPGLCIAIDPNDEHGVWWWQAGKSGCDSRSTGPGVFPAYQATVSRSSGGSTTAAFRLGTHSRMRPFIDVRLLVERGRMRAIDTGAQVAIQPRSNLNLPEMPPAGGRFGP
jgi:hypothetical protein